MKIFVTAQHQATLDLWRSSLPPSPDIRFFREGEVSEPVDALVMSGVWAFDRYGGRPNREEAQVLPNTRADGLPDWIIVPPFRPVMEREGSVEIRDDFKNVSPTYYAVIKSLEAAEREFGTSCTIALDLIMLGMANPNDELTPKSAGQAIEDYLTGHTSR